MHKTHHRRRRHHNRRTRRGGVKSVHTASAAPAAPAAARSPEMQKILDRLAAITLQSQSIKPSRRSGISKSQAAEKRFKDIMAGKVSQSTKKPFSKHGPDNRPGAGE